MLKEKTWYKVKTKREICETLKVENDRIGYNGLYIVESMFKYKKVFCKKVFCKKIRGSYFNNSPEFDFEGYSWQKWMLKPIYTTIIETE